MLCLVRPWARLPPIFLVTDCETALDLIRKPAFIFVSVVALTLPGVTGATAQSDSSFPRWSQFPAMPANVPKPEEYAARIKAQERVSAELHRLVSTLRWDQEAPETLADRVRNQIDPSLAQSFDPGANTAEINAFASDLKSRVNPPAQIDSLDDTPTLPRN